MLIPSCSAALPATSVGIAVYTLPEVLDPEWDKQLLGAQVVINVATLLEFSNMWQCNVPGLSTGPATLSITWEACDGLVSSATTQLIYD